MKRRDLIKTGLATIGASTIALSGCSKTDSSDINFAPKQTAQYEMSAPLPFNFKTIDEMVEFNSTIKKSQIKRLYNNIPDPLADKYTRHFIHERRGSNDSIKTLDDFGQYVKYAFDKGFEFSYLMNSPTPYSEYDFAGFKDNFLYLLDYLKKIGIKDIKVANDRTAYLINEYAPNEFNLQGSAQYMLHSISQYNNLFEKYNNFNFIDVPHDEVHNLVLLKNLKKLYPDKKIELITNQGCFKGCSSNVSRFCRNECRELYNDKEQRMKAFIKMTSIYPWHMPYYSAIGINNFKFIIFYPLPRASFHDISSLKSKLTMIENGYENYTWKDLLDCEWIPAIMVNDKNKNMKLSDIVPLFPDLKYFIQRGDKCDSNCEAECNYCFDCAKKLQKALYLT